jgi:hypothetical protein
MKKLAIVTLPAAAVLFLWAAFALAQSSNILIPYGMSAGMSVLNRAMQPRPAGAPTPEADAGGYGAQIGDRRLVCEQWTGSRWVVIHVSTRQCNP